MKFMTPCLRLYFSCYFDLFKLHYIISMSSIVLIYDNCGDVLTMMMKIRMMMAMIMLMTMMMMVMMISTNLVVDSLITEPSGVDCPLN